MISSWATPKARWLCGSAWERKPTSPISRFRSDSELLRARQSGHRIAALFFQIVGENYRLRQIAHGTAQPPAFVAQTQVRFLFGEAVLVLQNALGALHQFARLERALHLQG